MNDLLTELQCTQPPACNCYRLIILGFFWIQLTCSMLDLIPHNGSSQVGKTAIVKRFLADEFTDAHIPTIEDFHRKVYKIRNEVFQLDIVDTSGINPFPAMRRLSFLTGDAFLLVYSIDSRESFEEVLRLREQILESVRSAISNKAKSGKTQFKNAPSIPMIIAGNKCDKVQNRAVATSDVEHSLQRFKEHITFLECSAKDNTNIADLFETLFIMADFPDEMIPNAGRRISLTHGGNVLTSFNKASVALQGMLNSSGKPGEENGSKVASNTVNPRHGITLRRRLSDAYSALITNVRRPSIKADLIMVQEKREQPATPRAKNRKKRSLVSRKTSKNSSDRERESSSNGLEFRDDFKERGCFRPCWKP